MNWLNNADQESLAAAIAEWLEIRHKWGHEHLLASLKIRGQIKADLWHSGLLRRLLAGQKPLPKPPPLAHSGPWYGLTEGEPILVPERFIDVLEPDGLLLEGHLWRIESRYTANFAPAWRASYPIRPAFGDLFAPTPWRIAVEYAGMRTQGISLTREAIAAYQRRRDSGAPMEGLLRPEELPSGRPATVPFWQSYYRVTITQ